MKSCRRTLCMSGLGIPSIRATPGRYACPTSYLVALRVSAGILPDAICDHIFLSNLADALDTSLTFDSQLDLELVAIAFWFMAKCTSPLPSAYVCKLSVYPSMLYGSLPSVQPLFLRFGTFEASVLRNARAAADPGVRDDMVDFDEIAPIFHLDSVRAFIRNDDMIDGLMPLAPSIPYRKKKHVTAFRRLWRPHMPALLVHIRSHALSF